MGKFESNGEIPIQDCVATCDSLTGVDASFDAINYTDPYLDQGETFNIKVGVTLSIRLDPFLLKSHR